MKMGTPTFNSVRACRGEKRIGAVQRAIKMVDGRPNDGREKVSPGKTVVTEKIDQRQRH